MHKHPSTILKSLFLLFCLLSTSMVYAGTNDDIRKLLQLSGADERFDTLIPAFESDIQKVRGKANARTIKKMETVLQNLQQYYPPGALKKAALKRMKKDYKRKSYQALIRHFREDSYETIKGYQEVALSRDNLKEKLAYVKTFAQNPPTDRRMLLVKRFVQASGLVEQEAIQRNAMKKVSLITDYQLEDPTKLKMKAIEAHISNNSRAVKRQLEQDLTLSFVNAFRDTGNDEILELTRFYTTQEMKAYLKTLSASLEASYQRASKKLAKSVK